MEKGASTESYRVAVPTSAKNLFTVRDAAPFQDLALFAGVQSSFVGANFSAQMRAFFDCNFQHPIQLRETQGIVGQLGNLLSVLQGEPTYATQVRLRISASDDLPRTAYVFWALRTTERPPITDSHDMNLSFRELADDAACLFGSWFTNAKLFEPIYDVLVGTYGRQSERTKFRALAHALEGFHRAAYGGMYMSQESYKPIRKSLCAAIPADIEPEFQERLRAAIRYGFQYSLRTRETLNKLVSSR